MGERAEMEAEAAVAVPPTAFGVVRQPRRDTAAPLTGAVDVIVDSAERLGLLSYRVPEGVHLTAGDAVEVPFGSKTADGMVVRAGDPVKATKEVLKVHGTRADPSDVALALSVAKYHFVPPAKVLPRLAPSKHKAAPPLQPGPVALQPGVEVRLAPSTANRRVLLPDAATSMTRVAASEARRLSKAGQVLMLCPTTEAVEEVLSCFASGAVRLDSHSPAGAWKAFCEGVAPVGVGTRSAALYAAAELAGLVVVDESHPGHREPREPHTNARDLASARARSLRVPVTLVSEAPSPQALHGSPEVCVVGSKAPSVLVVDRTTGDPHEALVPAALRAAMSKAAKRGREVVVVASSTVTTRRCVRCGTVRPCSECGESSCRHTEQVLCPGCGLETNTRLSGWDAARVKKLLGSGVKVVSPRDIPPPGEPRMVVVFDVDAALATPSLVPESLAARLTAKASASAGSGGTVVVCTSDPKQPLVRDLAAGRGVLPACRRAAAAAKKLGLPPDGRVVKIAVRRKTAPNVRDWPGKVHGPSKNGETWEVLVRVSTDQLPLLDGYIAKLRRGGKARVAVE